MGSNASSKNEIGASCGPGEGKGFNQDSDSPIVLIIYRNLKLSDNLLVDQSTPTSFENNVYSKRDDIEEVLL